MKTSKIILQLSIAILPIIYILAIWAQLPSIIPMHYNGNNEVDRFGSKWEMLGVQIFMFLLNIGIAQLVANVHKLDPKKKIQSNNSIAQKISWIVLVFISLLSIYIIYGTSTYNANTNKTFSPKLIVVGVSTLFMLLGNFMNTVKPNYFIGFRTPWALENEENWKKTHRMGSKIWFFGSLLLSIALLITPDNYINYIMLIGIVPLIIIPHVYSFILFKQTKK